jgi:hypothetical protein
VRGKDAGHADSRAIGATEDAAGARNDGRCVRHGTFAETVTGEICADLDPEAAS